MGYFVEWDSLPNPVQLELEKMYVIAKGSAEKRLENYVFFLPFGLVYNKKKELMVIERENKSSDSQETWEKIYKSIIDTKDSLIMAAVVSNINIKNSTKFNNGITIDLHHSYGTVARVIVPYKMSGLIKKKPKCADFIRESFDKPFIWQPR